MQLPLPKTSDQNLSTTLTRWKSILDPVIADPLLSGLMVSGINLIASTPQVVNHSLSRNPLGWFLTDNTANSVVWRTQPFNNKTITLEASATTQVSIWVF
jgi:hypothetical protein